MYNKNYFIPRNAMAFIAFLKNILHHANANMVAWKIPADVLTVLNELLEELVAAVEALALNRTPANTKARNMAKAKTEKTLRQFIIQHLRYNPVTDADRVEMGIPNHDTVRTNHIEVLENVDFLITADRIRELSVSFWIHGANNKAKPKNYDGAVVIWQQLDTPPTKHSELTNHALASRTPYRIKFEETDRRKEVYVAMCWQNARGIRGAWTEIKSAYIT